MTVEQAITSRVSRRSYLSSPFTPAEKACLQRRASLFGRLAGGRIVLIEDGASMFARFTKSYGRFSGARAFFALVGSAGDPDSEEKLGYFGELLVLEATGLGLGTCWVGGTYDRSACPCPLDSGETLHCIITVGHCPPKRSVKESVIYHLANRGTKNLEEFYDASRPVPAWFMEGLQSVRRAPSAYNRQPVRLSFINGVVSASVSAPMQYSGLDLGIAKAHFALPAGGHWQWGSGAAFWKKDRGHYGMEVTKAIDALLRAQSSQTARAALL